MKKPKERPILFQLPVMFQLSALFQNKVQHFYLQQLLFWQRLSIKQILHCKRSLYIISMALVTFIIAQPLHAQTIGPSGLPLPRFVSIKSARVNVRVGPGHNYSIVFTYQKQGLPVEITQEYDQWRKIRDSDGDEGWIYQSLLSSRRTAMIAPWEKNKTKLTILRQQPNDQAAIAAEVEPSVIGTIRQCNGRWCEINVQNIHGWLLQTDIWGAYPGEKVDN